MILLPAGVFAQAKTQPRDVSKKVEARTGHKLNPAAKTASWSLPEGVSLDDGLSEDEAVAIALWNNPALQAELTAMGLARADLIEAGQLRNPSLTLIFPFSTRILEAIANWPFEALWQRPRRVAAAKFELERVEETLVSRAEAEIERAAKQLIAARQRVVAEVREAYTQLAQARESHQLWRARALPPLEEDIRSAERAYKAGDVAYLFVLETTRRLTDARLREADLQAATARAMAQLERSVGRRLIANR